MVHINVSGLSTVHTFTPVYLTTCEQRASCASARNGESLFFSGRFSDILFLTGRP